MVVQSRRPSALTDWTTVKNCLHCGVEFQPRIPARGNPQKFCSALCRDRSNDAEARRRKRTDRTASLQMCLRCGTEFLQPQIGAPKKYCSQTCLLKTHYINRKQLFETRSCELCASIYLAQIDRQTKYCSKRCASWVQERWPRRAKRKAREPRQDGRTCDECARPYWGSGKCASHYVKLKRRNGDPYPRGHKKRAAYWGVDYRPFNIRQLFAESNWICGICNQPVDPETKDSRLRASLDHIIPMSHGGPHSRENCQLAHVSCNSIKSNTLGRRP